MINATDLLAHNAPSDASLRFCSSSVAIFESLGANNWSLLYTAIASGLFFALIRQILHKRYGVQWDALVHALITSWGSLVVILLNRNAESIANMPEPLGAVLCFGPLTVIHKVLPAISMGYALFDLIDGLTLSIDFVLHGTGMLFLCVYFCRQAPEIFTPFLSLEVSTIFLTLLRAEFFSTELVFINQMLFGLTFLIFRVLLGPFIWFILSVTMWKNQDDEKFCHPKHMMWVTFFFGLGFHILNFYWFIKIIKKIRRKLRGEESIKANNDLVEGQGVPVDNNMKKDK